ncbi:hypothetical protein JMUB6875_21130 [Nocardia sp. JMUB6875]
MVRGTALEWVQCGNFRDTAARHVRGKTNDPLRASAQLGRKEASTIATVHYIDSEGYTCPAVDNVVAMESLRPSKREQSWNLAAARSEISPRRRVSRGWHQPCAARIRAPRRRTG